MSTKLPAMLMNVDKIGQPCFVTFPAQRKLFLSFLLLNWSCQYSCQVTLIQNCLYETLNGIPQSWRDAKTSGPKVMGKGYLHNDKVSKSHLRGVCFYSEIWWWPPKVIKFSTTRVDAQLMTRCLCLYVQSPRCLQRQYHHLGTTWSYILPKVTSLRIHLYPWKACFCFEITSHYIALASLELTDSSALVFWGNRNRNYRV